MQAEEITMVLMGIVILGVLIWIAVQNHRGKRKYLIARIRREWGSVPEREYTYEELASIAKYGERIGKEGFYLDDTTWNDLDMESIFMLMNHTMSSCGEDYLYAMLHMPMVSEEILEERERLIEFFRTHEKERLETQLCLARIGKMKDISMTDYIHRMEHVERRPVTKYVFLGILSLLSVAMLFLYPLGGVLFFLGMTILNVTLHSKESAAMEPYFKSFSCLLRILKAAEKLQRLDSTELKPYTAQIAGDAKAMRGIRNKARMLTNAKGMTDWTEILMAYINSFFLLDFIEFYTALREYDGHQENVECLIAQVGLLDSAIAIASFREYLPYFAEPEFLKGKTAQMEVKDLYHPLIAEPVANSICVQGGTLVTGSNASGKSTFLKNIAVNTILAQTIHTCVASSYRAARVRILTSMALKDDLKGGESYYIVEIKSIRRILQAAKEETPLLCIVDEVLRGTNTIERIAASSRILDALQLPHVLAFAATHDIELSYILGESYENYHFEEEICENDVKFNYLLKKGRATSRNAIALLEMIGYPGKVVQGAREAAMEFEKTGVWKILHKEPKAGEDPAAGKTI